MTDEEILKHVDYTLLKATATWEDIKRLCKEAVEKNTASVCIPPSYVKRVRNEFGNAINICTVIGFPLGYNTTQVKEFEAVEAVKDGADEIDMVINIALVKNGEYDKVEDEISILKKAVGEKVLKVIIETCYLTEEEKVRLCKVVTNAKADYIKTSTGFGTGGAKIEDVRLMLQHIGDGVRVKAAGGIRTREAMEEYLELGCERIGTSSAQLH